MWLIPFGLVADGGCVECAVELVEDLRSQGVLDEPMHVELTRLAMDLDLATEVAPGGGRDFGGFRERGGDGPYEVALCRFFARLAQVLARRQARDGHRWFAAPRSDRPGHSAVRG